MNFKDIYAKGCEAGYITDVTINQDSFSTVEEAVEAGVITDVNIVNQLLNGSESDPTIPSVPEVVDGQVTTDSAEGASGALDAGATIVNVSGDMKKPVELNVQKESTKLNFQEKQTEPVTVNQKNKVNNLTIDAPKGLSELKLNVPDATVTINGGSIDKITSNTANYTLVLKSGVVVNDLNVVKGNVLVHEGASIKNITKDPSNKSVPVIYTSNNPKSHEKDIPAAQKDVFEVLEYKPSNVIDRGGKMVLSKDAKLSPTSSSEFFGEIDLNGHTLSISGTLNSAVIASNKSLKITNGKITTSSYKDQQSVFKTQAGSILGFNNVDFVTDGTNVYASGKGSHLIVKDSKFQGHYAVATNASDPQELTIDLSHSTFNGTSTVFVNVPAKLNIDHCEINGKMHGVIVRGGNATITNSKINHNYTDSDFADMATYFDGKDWASGNTMNLAGIVMGNKDKKAYKYPTTVNLVNTQVTVAGHDDLFPPVYAWSYEFPVTFNYDSKCKFTGSKGLVYDNAGANITVNGKSVVA